MMRHNTRHTPIILELFLVVIFWVQTKSNHILSISNYPEHTYPACKFCKKHPKTTELLENQHHQVLLYFPTYLHFQPVLLSYIELLVNKEIHIFPNKSPKLMEEH